MAQRNRTRHHAPLAAAIGLVLGLLAIPTGASAARALRPLFSGADLGRPHVLVKLKPVMAGRVPLSARFPTEIRFLPGPSGRDGRVMVVAEKRGTLLWVDLKTGEKGYLLEVDKVGIDTEQGLVGFDFHPRFPEVPEVYTYHLAPSGFGGRSVVTRWTIWGDDVRSMTAQGEEVLSFSQPQATHNGGQLSFGPDGMLYLGLGDGGWQGDPRDRAQDPTNYHGKVIRIDVDRRDEGLAYAVPADNPFVAGGQLPEVWAFGFRNPWRFEFAPDGRLFLADVGQDRSEEIDIVARGGNYGWNIKEGASCFAPQRPRDPDCASPDLIDPVYEYGREDGRAIIGGRFFGGKKPSGLAGRYVFGDYTTGRLWGLAVSPEGVADVVALGGFGVAPVCFGRDPQGGLYLGVQGGRIYEITPD